MIIPSATRVAATLLLIVSVAQARVSVCAYLGDNGNSPWSFSDFRKELGGRDAATYHRFMQLDRNGFQGNDPDNFVSQVLSEAPNSEVMLTLELRNDMPTSLTDLTDNAFRQIAERLKKWNDQGITFHMRIWHEPNGRNSDGSTYYKHQTDPSTYKRVWRALAKAIKAATSTEVRRVNGKRIGATYTMWSVMPQNRDSKSDVNDFFPGADVVDEVGATYISQVPVKLPPRKDGKPNAPPMSLMEKMNYQWVSKGEKTAKSFYARYSKEMGMPLHITETARPTPKGSMSLSQETDTKWSWFDELYSEKLLRAFPKIRGICYLEMDRSGYGKFMHYGVFGRTEELTRLARGRLSNLASKGLVQFGK